MMEILRFWRDKTKPQKLEIMKTYGIKTITYAEIQKIYNENNKKL